MKCDEFRRAYNRSLDERKSSPLASGADLHARNCAPCRGYARAMMRMDECLRNLPEIRVPVEFLAPAQDSVTREVVRPAGFLPRLSAGIACGLPPALAWVLSGLLPPPSDTAMQFLLVSAALALFAFGVFRPRLTA